MCSSVINKMVLNGIIEVFCELYIVDLLIEG